MDWTAQSEEMLKTWTEVQKKMWDSWLGVVGDSVESTSPEEWQRVVEQVSTAWFQSVGRTLDAQVEWTRIWAGSLAGQTPAQTAAWAQQFTEAMQRWVEMQKQLWQGWFEMVRKAGPEQTGSTWESLWKTWEAAARQGLEAQAAWTRAWAPKPAAGARARA